MRKPLNNDNDIFGEEDCVVVPKRYVAEPLAKQEIDNKQEVDD
jgi:hypothetical protein